MSQKNTFLDKDENAGVSIEERTTKCDLKSSEAFLRIRGYENCDLLNLNSMRNSFQEFLIEIFGAFGRKWDFRSKSDLFLSNVVKIFDHL